jgi:hypothetical protein
VTHHVQQGQRDIAEHRDIGIGVARKRHQHVRILMG